MLGEVDHAHPTFAEQTLLPGTWLDRVLGLLRLKKQLILQGVPGTGKTHVARCLARRCAIRYDQPSSNRTTGRGRTRSRPRSMPPMFLPA